MQKLMRKDKKSKVGENLKMKEIKMNEQLAEQDRGRMPTKAQLLASEQEMLRRFRSALEQTKKRQS